MRSTLSCHHHHHHTTLGADSKYNNQGISMTGTCKVSFSHVELSSTFAPPFKNPRAPAPVSLLFLPSHLFSHTKQKALIISYAES